MKALDCPRESEVLMAVSSSRWPEQCAAELVNHVKACAICQDVVDVAMALGTSDEAEVVRVPSSAHMWWRLQMRARQDAARAAARPITVVQGVAAASIAGLLCAVVGFGWVASAWSNWSWSAFIAESGPAAETTFTSLMTFATAAPQTAVLLAALVAGLVLMPVAVYFALSE